MAQLLLPIPMMPPVPPPPVDGKRKCPLLQDEVWERILGYVKDPGDTYTLSNVCTLFQTITSEKPMEEMFLPMILEHPTVREEVFPVQFLDLSDVCPKWAETIRKDYDDRILRRIKMSDPILTSDPRYRERILGINFETRVNGERSLALIETLRQQQAQGRNEIPFYCRVVSVSVTSGADVNGFSDRFITLLNAIAPQVWMLECSFGRIDAVDLVQIYTLLQRWCSLLPNLKVLGIFAKWGAPFPYANIDNLMNAFPFPELPNLELLRFNDISPYLIERISFALPHLKRVDVVSLRLELHDAVLRTFHNMEGFKASLILLKHLDNIVQDVPWPLKTLELSLFATRFTTFGIFRMLGRFPMLEVLTLNGDDLKWRQKDNYLQLPELKVFKGMLKNRLLSLDFLMRCNKLEKLELQVPFYTKGRERPYHVPDRRDTIQFKGFLERMDESNIWQLFTQLKTISIELNKERSKIWTRRTSLPNITFIDEEVNAVLDW